MESRGINDNDFINTLVKLREEDPDRFMETVLIALRNNFNSAVEEPSPKENKIRALDRMIEHFEKLERYEDCAFIAELKQRICEED